jgi:tetratricopeptide (TPR) repeat protein
MSKDVDYDQLVAKAERYLAGRNYPLAKQAFERAAQARPEAEGLGDKIAQCNAGIAARQRTDLIKRGRKYDKQGKAREALDCFRRALATESEDWLAKKVAILSDALSRSEALTRCKEAERQADWEAALAACDEALAAASGSTPAEAGLIARKAELLARAGRHPALIELFRRHPPHDDRGDYLLGHALARNGQAVAAIDRWSRIEAPSKALLRQMEQLLPAVLAEAEADAGDGFERGYRALQRLPSPAAEPYRQVFRCRLIERYWRQARYLEIAQLIGPLPERMPIDRLGFYAKLYLQLAEQDAAYGEAAVDLWLTAIYNDGLLDSLYAVREAAPAIDRQSLRNALLERMQALIDRCRQQPSTATERLQRYWELQRRLIDTLSAMALDRDGGPDPFPCTPMFARRFGLSEALLDRLAHHRGSEREPDDTTLELLAYCSDSGATLLLAELGEPERALSELPPRSSDPVATYCRRRIALRLGIDKALRGEIPVKKWFQEARPLLEQSPRIAEELIALVYDEPESKAVAGLAEGMETLSSVLPQAGFREATAHILATHAILLHNQGVGDKAVERILTRALAIYPESHLAGNTLRELEHARIHAQFAKAMRQQNLAKATDIVLRTDSSELRDHFFQALRQWLEQAQNWDRESKQAILHEMSQQAVRVDPEHPVTLEIADLLQSEHR